MGYYGTGYWLSRTAGYGRDWRTGSTDIWEAKIFLTQVRWRKILSKFSGVDAERIGIYGEVMGGFITRGLFTTPWGIQIWVQLFVCDWLGAITNHGYTQYSLNTPEDDSYFLP